MGGKTGFIYGNELWRHGDKEAYDIWRRCRFCPAGSCAGDVSPKGPMCHYIIRLLRLGALDFFVNAIVPANKRRIDRQRYGKIAVLLDPSPFVRQCLLRNPEQATGRKSLIAPAGGEISGVNRFGWANKNNVAQCRHGLLVESF